MLITKGGMAFSEIMEQPNDWKEAIKVYNKERETLVWIRKAQFSQVVFTGEGPGYYGAIFAASMFRSVAKMQAMACHTSELFSGDNLPFNPRLRTLIIPISRSGQGDTAAWAIEHVRKQKKDVQVISVSCLKDTPLSKVSNKTILLDKAVDDGMVSIRSFSTSMFLLALMAGALGGDKNFLGELNTIIKDLDLKEYHELIMKTRQLQSIRNVLYFGLSGYQGLAGYGSLLMKEMSLTPAQYYNTIEFRHNHFVAVHPDNLSVYLLSDNLRDQELSSMRDAAKMKSQIFLLADDLDEMVEAGVEYSIKFKSEMSYFARAFHIIPCLQLLAFQHTLSKGKNPDKPKHIIEDVKYKKKPEWI